MAGDEKKFTDFLHGLPCYFEGHDECRGVVHVHHAQGRKGLGTRNSDATGKPLCALHHTQRHALSGVFKGFRKADIREWEERVSAHYRGLYLGVGEPSSF